MNKYTAAGITLVLGFSLLACSGGGPIDLGKDDDAIGEQLAAFAGSWDGYAEGYTFLSGSDRVRLQIDSPGTPVLELGDVELPPMQAKIGYPPILDSDPDMFEMPYYFEGFAYPLYDINVQENRLRATIHLPDAHREWCALQTPALNTIPDADNEYVCVWQPFNQTWDQCSWPDTMESIDCQWALTCDRVCQCTQTECHLDPAHPLLNIAPIKIDATLSADGRTLDGTLVNVDGDRAPIIKLVRQ